MDDFLSICIEAAVRGAAILKEVGRPSVVKAKSLRDLVTEADVKSQQAIADFLRKAYPSHQIQGEEAVETPPAAHADDHFVWVIDPLDGTTNFVHGVPFWCVSLALLHYGHPIVGVVLDPVRDDCVSAARGCGCSWNGQSACVSSAETLNSSLLACSFSSEVRRDSEEVRRFLAILPEARAIRRMGSTAMNLAYVATGRFDGFWTSSTHVWDVAAGGLLVHEAGGVVTALNGLDWQPQKDPCLLAAATGPLSRAILECWR